MDDERQDELMAEEEYLSNESDNDNSFNIDNEEDFDASEEEDANEDWWNFKETLHGGEPVYVIDLNPAEPAIFATGGGDDRAVLSKIVNDHVVPIAELAGHSDTVDRLRFSPDGRFLATGGMDGTIMIWDGHTGEMQTSFSGLEGEVGWLAWHPDSKRPILAAGSLGDGVIWQWNVESQQCISVLRANSQRSLAGQYSPNGKYLVTTDVSRVFVWSVAEGGQSKQVLSYSFSDAADTDIVSLSINQTSTMAVVGSASGKLYMLSLLRQDARPFPARHDNESSIEWVSFAPGRLPFIMSAGLDGAFQVYEQHDLSLRSKNVLPSFKEASEDVDDDCMVPNGITSAVLMSRSELFVLGGSVNGTVAMWDVRSGIKVASLGNSTRAACLGVAHLPPPIDILFGVFDDGRLLGISLKQLELQH